MWSHGWAVSGKNLAKEHKKQKSKNSEKGLGKKL